MTIAPSPSPTPTDVDPIAQVLGNFGKWQLRTMLIIFLCKVPTSWFMAIVIFTAPAPYPGEYWCTPTQPLSGELLDEWISLAHVKSINNRNRTITDYCHVYSDLMENPWDFIGPNKTRDIVPMNMTIVACDSFTFKSDIYYSLVEEFVWVCERKHLISLSQCFHIFGLLVGGIIAYFMLKYVSPKNVMMIGIAAQIIFGTLLGLVHQNEWHIVLRWLTAASCALMYTSGSMIFVDITNGAAKIITSLVFEFFWSIGLIVLPIFALFIEQWWKLYIAISMPTICLIFLLKYLPDSPRWLLKNGRIDEARQILIDGGTKNKRRVPINLEDLLRSEYASGAADPPQADWCELFDGNPPRIYILSIHFAWCVYVLNFNCVVLNIRAYGRDHLSINTVAIGFSEILGVFIGIYLVLYTRRRWLWAGLFGIASGTLAYFSWFIPQTLKETHVVALEMAPTLAIKAATSIGMCVLTVCTIDLVSKDRKKILMFSSTVFSRALFLWAPFIFILQSYNEVLPLTVFATLSVVGGLSLVLVHANQYQTYLEDCEQRMQAMRTMRSISSAGMDWMKTSRRKSVYDISEETNKQPISTIYDVTMSNPRV